MNIFNNCVLGSEIIRHSCQTIESGYLFLSHSSYLARTASTLDFLIMSNKLLMTISDLCGNTLRSLTPENKFAYQVLELHTRVIDVFYELYHLHKMGKNPPANFDRVKLYTYLDIIINTQRAAFSILSTIYKIPSLSYLSHGLSLINAATKITFMVFNGSEIKQKILEFYRRFPFDYTARCIGHMYCILLSSSAAIRIVTTNHLENPFLISALTLSLIAATKAAVHEIFKGLNIPLNLKRQASELTISVIAGSAIGFAASVGMGLSPSIGEIVRKSAPPLLALGLLTSIGFILKKGQNEIYDYLRIRRNDPLRVLGEWSFTIAGSLYLTTSALVGFQLAANKTDALREKILNSMFLPIALGYSVDALNKMAHLHLLRIMSWKDQVRYILYSSLFWHSVTSKAYFDGRGISC